MRGTKIEVYVAPFGGNNHASCITKAPLIQPVMVTIGHSLQLFTVRANIGEMYDVSCIKSLGEYKIRFYATYGKTKCN